MNILMIHPHDIYSPKEPWTIRIKNIAREFVKKGHRVKLVYFPLDNAAVGKRSSEEGIEIFALDRRLGPHVFLKNVFRVMELAACSDVIHFQKCYYYVSLPALLAGLVKNKPVHYDWDDWETKIFYYSNRRQWLIGEFLNLFENLVPLAVDTISVSSKHLKDNCLKKKIPSQRIFSAPVGADMEAFMPTPGLRGIIRKKYNIKGSFVLYVGQIHGGQYAELFIKAAASIVRNKPDAVFMIVGDGYRLQELKELSFELGVDENFIFAGHVPHNEIPAYLTDADICVACFEENDITKSKSPLKIVEYMSMGKPIVASNVGEVRNMLGGLGVLVKPGDAGSLAEGITLLLDNKSMREELGCFTRRRIEKKYNWSVTADNLLKAYQAAQANKRSSRILRNR